MIAGIGVDIVHVPRIQKSLDRYGDRFAHRILTHDEYKDYLGSKGQAQFLAKRFAAKEATVKALGTGFRNGLSLRDIGVSHDAMGRPMLDFSSYADTLCVEKGIVSGHVSLADEKAYAIAFVTLLTK